MLGASPRPKGRTECCSAVKNLGERRCWTLFVVLDVERAQSSNMDQGEPSRREQFPNNSSSSFYRSCRGPSVPPTFLQGTCRHDPPCSESQEPLVRVPGSAPTPATSFFFSFFFPPVGLSILPKPAPPAVLDAETRTAAKHFRRGYRFLTMEHNSKAQWIWSHILVQFISSPRVDHGQALLTSLGELHTCVIFGVIRQCIRYLLP